MNIKQAKEQIKNAVKSYFTKDEKGEMYISIERQRPIFLMGPPGIGKTAIMEQIANELGVGLVTYSMTHHTRQSALGLPFIVKKKYGDKEYSVSEYTMSEIIASVYDMIESGAKEGILFLDEINCVSETLAPSMLQFLQYKVFGTHKVPDGWIVVTAGNPPEFNNSVREFDIVTWDRLKRIDIEPDFKAWIEYARYTGVHPSITSYLEIKDSSFYSIETTVDGKRFVTARGWVDLSDMIKLYEMNNIKVDYSLVIQYLQNSEIAKDFSVYYDLFLKYKSDYQIDKILDGSCPEDIIRRAKSAKFDERLSLLSLVFDGVSKDIRKIIERESLLKVIMDIIKPVHSSIKLGDSDNAAKILKAQAKKTEEKAKDERNTNMIGRDEYRARIDAADTIYSVAARIDQEKPNGGEEAYQIVKSVFNDKKDELKKSSITVREHIDNALLFCEGAFGVGHEITMLVTEFTSDKNCAHFISSYGSDQYFRFNKELLIHERQIEIIKEIDELELDSESSPVFVSVNNNGLKN